MWPRTRSNSRRTRDCSAAAVSCAWVGAPAGSGVGAEDDALTELTGGSIEEIETHTDAVDPASADEARPLLLPCLSAPTRTHKLRPASQSASDSFFRAAVTRHIFACPGERRTAPPSPPGTAPARARAPRPCCTSAHESAAHSTRRIRHRTSPLHSHRVQAGRRPVHVHSYDALVAHIAAHAPLLCALPVARVRAARREPQCHALAVADALRPAARQRRALPSAVEADANAVTSSATLFARARTQLVISAAPVPLVSDAIAFASSRRAAAASSGAPIGSRRSLQSAATLGRSPGDSLKRVPNAGSGTTVGYGRAPSPSSFSAACVSTCTLGNCACLH